ncbi:virulence-associated E family protein [Rhodalgimonas zhirmunskyi]|uniref:Virulence-associated E family protein n=1 Tax=Rhodalgimonas zhirmunskyi TaxID=2964767 RepID=A0AAJ1X6D3_9RHOB|nr:virulence-associated E family protein [Rhodoalgimonas zhirmunskyi]MDQ2093292.1 virulence-associated E family protein [Rhodoalgimonas zhirmunskyi]
MTRAKNSQNKLRAQPTCVLDRPLNVTIFPDEYAASKKSGQLSLREIEVGIKKRIRPRKSQLKFVKLALFGEERSSRACYRTNANVLSVEGIEGDYDGEVMSPEEARDLLAENDIAGLIYTTPSHTPEKPRWRVMCPFSKALEPEDRAVMLARVNGVLGGILARESFTLSQAFYYGGVGKPVETFLVEGRALDHAEDLDEIAQGPDRAASGEPEIAVDQSDIPEAVEYAEAMLERAADKVREAGESGESRTDTIHNQARWMGGFVACNTLSEEDVLEKLFAAADDVGHSAQYGVSETERHIRNGIANGAAFPLPWFDPMDLLEEEPEGELDPETQADIEELVGPTRNESIARKEWGKPMLRGDGLPVINLHNTVLYLGRNVGSILPGLAQNLMTHRDEWSGGEIDDDAIALARMALEARGLKTVGKELVADAIRTVAKKLSYHPIRDYLSAHRWDGKPRLDTWLIRLAGADDTPYTRAVSRKFLIQMAARVMKPGCKADYTMVWSGEQGQDKSKACRILAGTEYFSETLPSIRGNKEEALRHLQGLWLIELAELAPSRTADQEDQKAFLSGSIDRVRLPYARLPQLFKRQCVFVGTTNDDQFLKDPTGGRRYWPVAIRQVFDTVALDAERDQLFAEAMDAFNAGEEWWLDREFEAEHVKPVQAAANVEDSWAQPVAKWLDKSPCDELDDDPRPKDKTTVSEVLSKALCIDSGRQDRAAQNRAAAVLKTLGWIKKHTNKGSVWLRPEE